MTLTPAQRQTLTWTAIGVVAALLLWRLAPVLTPFLVGAGLAYVLRPAVERLVARRWPRALAVLLVETLAIVGLLTLVLLVVPIITKELPQLKAQLPLLADRLNDTVAPWLAQFGIQVSLDSASIKEFVLKHFDANAEDWMARAFASARIGGSYVLAAVGNAVLVPLVLFYLLMDWPQLTLRIQALVPPRQQERVQGFLVESDEVLGQYLRGQLLVMLVLAAYYAIGLALFGFHLALPVGVLTGLLVFIPYLGYGLGLALALVAALLQFGNWFGLIGVAVVYGFGQVLESFYLTPRLVGERIGLSPLAVIFALLAFGELFGFVGVLIALPVSAVMLVAVRRLRNAYIGSRLYTG
ncbi:MAG: AI-2E family transporter [Pseudomonadota bacterium]